MNQIQDSSAFNTDKRRFQLFVLVFGTVAASLPLILWSINQFTIRSYTVAVLLWLLVSSEVFAPTSPETVWWSKLQWIKIAALIILGYIVFERVSAVM